MNEKLLEFVYAEQRRELDYRRNRENEIFTWSSSILLAAIGGLLVISGSENAIIAFPSGKALATATVVLLVCISISWQLYQASASDKTKRIITHLGEWHGVFKEDPEIGRSWYDERWKKRGKGDQAIWFRLSRPSRVQATFLLGAIAVALIWLR